MMNEIKKEKPHILIKVDEDSSITRLFIDGKEIDGVRRLRFDQTAGKLPILNIDLIAFDMEIDGRFIPALPDIFRPFYCRND